MSSLWSNSAPNRSRNSDDPASPDHQLTQHLIAAEKRTESRLTAIEESLEAIKRHVGVPASPPGVTFATAAPAAGSSKSAPAGAPAVGFTLPNSPPAAAGAIIGSSPADAPRASSSTRTSLSVETEEERLAHVGTLTVHIKRANNLIKADFRGLSDPYAVLQLSLIDQEIKRTTTHKNTLNPVWDERLEFDCELRSLVDARLKIELFDEDFGALAMMTKGLSGVSGGKKATKAGSSSELEAAERRNSNAQIDSFKNNKDDKLGKINDIPLDFLRERNSMDFEAIQLEGVKTGTLTFSISWAATSDDDNEVKALVERDQEIRNMLNNVRQQMDHHAAKLVEGEKTRLPMKRGLTKTLTTRSPSPVGADGDEDRARWGRRLCGPVLHPDGKFRSGWNVMLAFLIMYCGIQVPLEISFDTDMSRAMCGIGEDALLRSECPHFLTWFWCNFVIDILFLIDIFVNFRTGFVHEGHFVDDEWLAATKYFKREFAVDFVGSFPLNLVWMVIDPSNIYGDELLVAEDAQGQGDVGRLNRVLRMVRMAKLFKLFRMAKLAKYLSGIEDYLNPAVVIIAKLVGMMFMVSHIFGCLWWLISSLEREDDLADSLGSPWYGPENQWMAQMWLVESPRFSEKYSHSFLWGAGMVTAMVPFDIMPVTVLENWVTVVAMFIGLVLNAIVISSLTTALSTMYAKKQLTGSKLDTIRNYLVLKAVPNDLRSRVLEFYDYYYSSQKSLADSINYSTMPANLATQLALSINRKLAAKCTFFREVSNASIVTLIAELVPDIFVPKQLIVFEGHPLSNVYFINRGFVQLLEKTHPVGQLRENDNFGLDEFVSAMDAREAPTWGMTVQSVTYCDVMALAVDKLAEALAQDETYKERHVVGPSSRSFSSRPGGTSKKLSIMARSVVRIKTRALRHQNSTTLPRMSASDRDGRSGRSDASSPELGGSIAEGGDVLSALQA